MAVRWTKIEETSDTANMPTTSGNTYQVGINAPGGPVEFLQLKYNMTFGDNPCPTSEISSILDNVRVVLNGEVVFDWNAGTAANDTDGSGQFNYVINSTGGRVVEIPTATPTTREGYINIPLGRQTPAGVNRYEIFVTYAATRAGATISSGSLQWWLRFNDGMQTTTTLVPATSFVHAASIEQVVVRIPQNVPGVVSAIAILNDTNADEFGNQGIRINALSDFGITPEMWRAQNGDLQNGIMYSDGGAINQTSQTYATQMSGALVVPTLGLTGGDVVLTVDSSSATTRKYIPIITAPVGAREAPDVKQTQRVAGNTQTAILSGSLK